MLISLKDVHESIVLSGNNTMFERIIKKNVPAPRSIKK